ncbi:MAG TPA: alpha-amylase family glycosyl hydrolase, partial [Rubricoccaceae bacterium]
AVPPASPFKFRVDDAAGAGRWLDPPASAPNVESGNHVFLSGVTPPRLVAELRGDRAVWVRVTGADRPLRADAYRITRWDGAEVPVAAVYPNEAETALLVPAEALATNQVHYVTIPGTPALRSAARFDGLWRELASDKPLGAEVVDEGNRNTPIRHHTDIRLFAPRADSVRVFLYDGTSGPERESYALRRDAQGVWETTLTGDRSGDWYDFGVFGPAGPGSAFTTQTGRRYSDPYGRVSDDSWGRTRIARRTTPATPLPSGRPRIEDVVAYEVHVQDFTDRLPVADGLRGTFDAFATPGLTNARGEPIGIDHLVRLGVNTVHLMPVQEYLNYPDDVWAEAFGTDSLMRAMGVATENYDWGYRITHFMAVEGRYRRRGTEPGAEREQFRDLVQAFHDRGMAVVVDFVFNHTGENMEGRDNLFNFGGIDRLYYYRTDNSGALIGGYGNEVKSENRPFVQRWLVDQCRAFVEEFGVDGFRIDLAGQTDEQSLRALRAALPADLIWYGEPWIASNDPDYEANPAWDWYKADSPITYFQDDARNAFQGTPDAPRNPASDRGWAGGNASLREAAVNAVLNRWPDEADPTRGINYLDIHDNWTLADRFASCTTGACAWDGRAGVDEAAVRIAATLLLTSLGPVVLNGGTEILRSKGAAPRPDEIGGQIVARTALSPIYINGRGDTYNLRTPNQYDWERVGAAPADGDPDDVAAMLDWWRGLIALRLSPAGAVFRTASPDAPVRFLRPADEHALGYVAGGETGPAVLVLLNAGAEAVAFDGLPSGRWRPVARAGTTTSEIDPAGLGRAEALPARHTLAPGGVAVWVRE